MWRAIRYGLDGKLIDFAAEQEVPARAAVERLLEWTEPARAALKLDAHLERAGGGARRRATAPSGSGAGTRPGSRHETSTPRRVAETCATYADASAESCGQLEGDDVNAEQSPVTTRCTRRRRGTPSEEELRARLEEELKKITVRDVLRADHRHARQPRRPATGAERRPRSDSRDLEQSRMAIEAVRALLPLLEQQDAEEVRPLRDALAQLQMAYAHEAGPRAPTATRARRAVARPPPPGQGRPAAAPQGTGRPGPAAGPPRRGGLWVPPGSDD